MKKLTKREKVIIVLSAVALGAVYMNYKGNMMIANDNYKYLTSKLLSGGVWKATDITDKTFKLVAVSCCGGCKK